MRQMTVKVASMVMNPIRIYPSSSHMASHGKPSVMMWDQLGLTNRAMQVAECRGSPAMGSFCENIAIRGANRMGR